MVAVWLASVTGYAGEPVRRGVPAYTAENYRPMAFPVYGGELALGRIRAQGGDRPIFFRTIAPDDRQAQVQVDFTLGVLNRRNTALLHDKWIYGKGLAGRTGTDASGLVEKVLFLTEDFNLRHNRVFQRSSGQSSRPGYQHEEFWDPHSGRR